MMKEIFRFELKYRISRPATWAYFGILFLFGFLTAIYGGLGSSEKTLATSPYIIAQTLTVLSLFGMLISSAVMGVPVYRDEEYGTKHYFFSYPFSEKEYLVGRFFGSFLVLLLISLGLIFGLMLGNALGPVLGLEDADRFGSFSLWYYLQPILLLYWPNFLFTGSLFFALVALTRKVFVTYVGSILLFIGYLLANTLVQDLEYVNIVDILDPFALNTLSNVTKYWTPVEQNSLVIPLEGNMLWNRLLWISVGLGVFAFTLFRFDFKDFMEGNAKKKKGTKEAEDTKPKMTLAEMPKVSQVFSGGIYLKQMFSLSRIEFKNIIRDPYFIAILLGGVLFLFLDGWFGNSTYGTPSLPVTYLMLEAKSGTYALFAFIIVIFYTGETVHRDKQVNYSNIADALPVPNWVTYGSKFLSLVIVCFLLSNLPILCGMLNQVLKGYFEFELGMYIKDLWFITFPNYVQLTMLAFIVHILVNSKFTGHVVNIAIWLFMFGVQSIAEINYNLFFFGNTSGYLISDMNGFGHFVESQFWFNFYWLALGAAFLVIGNLFWNRGSESAWKARFQLAKERLNPTSITSLAVFLGLWVASGAFIYYNVSVLNEYRTSDETKELQANYEKTYKKYERVIQPKITDVKVWVDIYPEERRTEAKGVFMITNKSNQPIDSLHLSMPAQFPMFEMKTLTIGGKTPEVLMDDEDMNYRIVKMPETLQPGDSLEMIVELEAGYKGFPNGGFGQAIVYNGTFFNAGIFPSFGYNSGFELGSDKDRKEYDLPIKEYSAPPKDDPWGLSNLLFNDDAEYVTFEATVSTAPDQIAVAPGYLQREWEENGRKYYHYKMNDEMDLFFNFSSAAYAVHRDEWKGENGEKINIEIFHDPKHTYNLDRFVDGVKHSFDYYNKNFSPYQYTQMRILEFPRYATFAQSFPNTVPYSEGFGWTADFSDPNNTDYAYYVTAHEVAHQWWGHQITPSATRGANQISETMAEYSALMVLKKAYSPDGMQKFLKYSLDSYLRGRARESKFEKTLLDNDTQSYVWYRKGSVVLYALQDYVGEEALNTAFSEFLDSAAFRQEAPFATSDEWYSYIKKAVPDSMQYFIEDCFENIVLYENRCKEAKYRKVSDNEYEVTLQVNTAKKYYGGNGEELKEGTEPSLIEIGIFAEDTKNEKGMEIKDPVYLKKMWLKPGEHSLKFTIDRKPVKAGIDPYNKLIDRISDDNLVDVDELEES